METPQAAAPDLIHYLVNGEVQTTTTRELTPREIVRRAGLNPDENYLVEIREGHKKSFQDSMDTEIKVHEHQRFITVFIGPTPVS